MRVSEAKAIGEQLAKLDAASIAPCLNLGSSTSDFREGSADRKPSRFFGPVPDLGAHQPHIHQYVFKPLEARGVRVIHADIKEGNGIDLVGDVYDPAYRERVKQVAPRLVICSNILEHLPDREGFVAFCRDVLVPGGYALVTVPRSYPYHADPIDTGYRPSPEELVELFPGYEVIWKATIEDTNHWVELQAMPLLAWPRLVVSGLVKLPYLALADRSRFMSRYHRLLWLFRRYSVSCALLRKPG